MLERNGHGGDWLTASAVFGYAAEEMLDFSANINPLGPPAGLKDLFLAEWNHLSRYPDPEVRELRECISRKYEIDMTSILAGNGAAEIIDLIVRYLRPRKAAVVEPTFSEYAEALVKVNAGIQSIPALPEENFAVQVDDLFKVCEEVDLIFLGQPNNPTGQWLHREALIELMKKATMHDCVLVLDEAFIDFFPNEREVSLICEAERSKHLIVVRSMTKFYAIPGLRLGYAVAHPHHIDSLKRLQVPWSVNHLSQKAGVVSLSDQEYEKRTRAVISQERPWLVSRLQSLGCVPFEGPANFLLVRIDDPLMNALALQRALGEQGILIRRCVNFIGLDDRFFRIAVRNHTDNERLIASLKNILH